MKEEIMRLFDEKRQLTFQEIYLQVEGKYRRHCPFQYERDRILEGVVKNQIAILVNQKRLTEIMAEDGEKYMLAGGDEEQKITHAA